MTDIELIIIGFLCGALLTLLVALMFYKQQMREAYAALSPEAAQLLLGFGQVVLNTVEEKVKATPNTVDDRILAILKDVGAGGKPDVKNE